MNAHVKERSADELFKEFKEVSITEFFRKNRAHLGYSGKLKSLTTIVHEIVTNALDACEESGILPEIYMELRQIGVEHYLFIARDNGPGIPVAHIPSVFGKMLAGTKFHRNVQLRGQQGIGVSGVTMFSQMTTGQPMNIKTSTGKGRVYTVKLMLDITKNSADIIEQNEYSEYWRGTEVVGEIKNVKFTLSDQGPFEYLRRTAIANPHAKITFVDPEGRKTVFERSVDQIPKPPEAQKPHPKGIEVDDLFKMAKSTKANKLSSFLTGEFSRMSSSKAREIQEYLGKEKREVKGAIVEAYKLDLKKNPRKLTWAECEMIVDAIQNIKFLAPAMEGLQPIDEEHIKKAVLNILDPEFQVVLTRPPKVYSGGIPFQVEVALAYGGHAGRNIGEGVKAEIMRFANRSPLLFDAGGCALTQAVNEVDWKRYGIKDFETSPLTIFINLISTYVPYTSAGKQTVSVEVEIVKEIKFALMDVARKFQIFHSRQRRAGEKEARRQLLIKYSTELAEGLSRLSAKGDEKRIHAELTRLIEEKLKLAAEMELLDEGSEEEEAPAEEEVTEEEAEEMEK
ncbi:MAG: DNA topoisomerase VI subunit B [Candidatus Altiarchaeota archaeon]|nr:DNA topoisomerase VI subunit B [Candidatus Altiarchaeota archaeon]